LGTFYCALVFLYKLPILFIYLQSATSTTNRRLSLGLMATIIVWGLASILVSVFQCEPISLVWTYWDGEHPGQCTDRMRFFQAHGIINVIFNGLVLGFCFRIANGVVHLPSSQALMYLVMIIFGITYVPDI
jgi:hypothetical protein